jgi:hypothetical protein
VTTFVELIRAELLASQAVSDLVGERIFPGLAPQGEAPPFVVLTVPSEVPASSFTSTSEDELRQARVQVDCYAKTYLGADAVAKAVNAVVADLARPDLSAVRLVRRELYDDEAQLHRVSADYAVAN